MNEEIQSTVDRIIKLTKRSPYFDKLLREQLNLALVGSTEISVDEHLEQIYEYCIERVVRRQAEDFYKNFPLEMIIPQLQEDYCRMEYFHRKGRFDDFCLAAYQQIEAVTNKMCVSQALDAISSVLWGYPAYVKSGKGITPVISERTGEYTVADLVLIGKSKADKVTKTKISLQSQFAMDKVRAIVYFVGYGAVMPSSEYSRYQTTVNLIYDLYKCRNLNHRGNENTSSEKSVIDRVLSNTSIYYYKFMAVLTEYMDFIREGYEKLPSLNEFVKTLEPKNFHLPGPKVVGQMDVSKYQRKIR